MPSKIAPTAGATEAMRTSCTVMAAIVGKVGKLLQYVEHAPGSMVP